MITFNSKEVQELAGYIFLTLLLQAIVFGVLGIIIIIYPRLVEIWLAANFVWMGVSTSLLAWKIHQLIRPTPQNKPDPHLYFPDIKFINRGSL